MQQRFRDVLARLQSRVPQEYELPLRDLLERVEQVDALRPALAVVPLKPAHVRVCLEFKDEEAELGCTVLVNEPVDVIGHAGGSVAQTLGDTMFAVFFMNASQLLPGPVAELAALMEAGGKSYAFALTGLERIKDRAEFVAKAERYLRRNATSGLRLIGFLSTQASVQDFAASVAGYIATNRTELLVSRDRALLRAGLAELAMSVDQALGRSSVNLKRRSDRADVIASSHSRLTSLAKAWDLDLDWQAVLHRLRWVEWAQVNASEGHRSENTETFDARWLKTVAQPLQAFQAEVAKALQEMQARIEHVMQGHHAALRMEGVELDRVVQSDLTELAEFASSELTRLIADAKAAFQQSFTHDKTLKVVAREVQEEAEPEDEETQSQVKLDLPWTRPVVQKVREMAEDVLSADRHNGAWRDAFAVIDSRVARLRQVLLERLQAEVQTLTNALSEPAERLVTESRAEMADLKGFRQVLQDAQSALK